MTRAPKAKLAERILLWLSVNKTIDGLWIGAAGDASALQPVEAALNLIKKHDPRRYDRLRHDLIRVWIRLLPGDLACFNAAFGACELDTRFVLEHPPEIIAATLVHEATHARLWRTGIDYVEESRHRIEAICIRQELVFAGRLPKGTIVLEWAEARLLQPSDLSDQAFGARHLTGSIEAFRHSGAPEWLVQAVLALRTYRIGIEQVFRSLRRP
jgi:hypothetical protein